MKRRYLSAAILFVVWISACSHAPTHEPKAELADLQEQLRATVVKILNTRPDVQEVKSVKILKADQTADLARISYQADYDTDSKEIGLVNHTVVEEVTLIKTDEKTWKISAAEPKSQSIVFNRPMEIVARKK